MAHEHMKRYLTSLAGGGMQINHDEFFSAHLEE